MTGTFGSCSQGRQNPWNLVGIGRTPCVEPKNCRQEWSRCGLPQSRLKSWHHRSRMPTRNFAYIPTWRPGHLDRVIYSRQMPLGSSSFQQCRVYPWASRAAEVYQNITTYSKTDLIQFIERNWPAHGQWGWKIRSQQGGHFLGLSEFWQGVVVHWGMVLWRFPQACLHQAEEGGQIPRALWAGWGAEDISQYKWQACPPAI